MCPFTEPSCFFGYTGRMPLFFRIALHCFTKINLLCLKLEQFEHGDVTDINKDKQDDLPVSSVFSFFHRLFIISISSSLSPRALCNLPFSSLSSYKMYKIFRAVCGNQGSNKYQCFCKNTPHKKLNKFPQDIFQILT